MDVVIGPALALLYHLIELYTWVLIIGVIMSWLITFNVINLSNQFVRMIYGRGDTPDGAFAQPYSSDTAGPWGRRHLSSYPDFAPMVCQRRYCASCTSHWLRRLLKLFQKDLRSNFA